MKTCLILEDTPEGLKAKLIWQPSDHLDALPDSKRCTSWHSWCVTSNPKKN